VEASSKPHTPNALPRYPLNRKLVDLRAGPNALHRRKTLAVSLITIWTELPGWGEKKFLKTVVTKSVRMSPLTSYRHEFDIKKGP